MILLKVSDQSRHNKSVHEHRFPGHLETVCCRPVKKECKLKQPERLTKLLPSRFVFEVGIFAYREKPFEQTLKLKKSIYHHSLLNLFFRNI